MPYDYTNKLERLFTTFEDNFRITRLYADYLSIFPEIITEEMKMTCACL